VALVVEPALGCQTKLAFEPKVGPPQEFGDYPLFPLVPHWPLGFPHTLNVANWFACA
jgi:hypothetical protein